MMITDARVMGWEMAIKGMRNPRKSWKMSDSVFEPLFIGENDMALMKRLVKGGAPERKFLRMIHVQINVSAPLFWWKQFDTYKIGTTANSESTMHMLAKGRLNMDNFVCPATQEAGSALYNYLGVLNALLSKCDDESLPISERKQIEHDMFLLLPDGYLQRRTVDMDYETCLAILRWRSNHKLPEWREFCEQLLRLPYLNVLYTAMMENKAK